MTKPNRKKLIIIISISLFVVVGIIAGIVAIVKKQNVREVGTSAFTIGHINSVSGMYEQSSASIYTSELIACRGLSITPDFESNVKYQVYFYDMDKLYLGCTEVLTTKYTLPKDDVESFYCRIVVYPEENEYGEDPYVFFFDIPFIVNNLDITVDKEQDISKLLKLALEHRITTWVEDYVNVYYSVYVGDHLPYYNVTEDDMSSITNFSCPDDVYDSAKFYNALNTAKSKVEKNAYAKFLKYFSNGKGTRYFTSAECDEVLKSKTLFELLNNYTKLREDTKGTELYTFFYNWNDNGSEVSDPGFNFVLEGNRRNLEYWTVGPFLLNDGESIQLRLRSGSYTLVSDLYSMMIFNEYSAYDYHDWVDENGIPSWDSGCVYLSREYISMDNLKSRVTITTNVNNETTVEHIFDSQGNYSVNVFGYLYGSAYSLLPQLNDGDYIEFTLRFNKLIELEKLDTYFNISYKTTTKDSRFKVDCVKNTVVPQSRQVFVNTGNNFPFAPIKESVNAQDWENVPTWKVMVAKFENKLYFLGYDEDLKSYKIIGYDEVGSSSVQIRLSVTAATTAYYQDYVYENLTYNYKDDMASFIENSK